MHNYKEASYLSIIAHPFLLAFLFCSTSNVGIHINASKDGSLYFWAYLYNIFEHSSKNVYKKENNNKYNNDNKF
jgi:hypothetical protein